MQVEKITVGFMSTPRPMSTHDICHNPNVVIAEKEVFFLKEKKLEIPKNVILLKITGEGFFDPNNIRINDIINVINPECKKRQIERIDLFKKEYNININLIRSKIIKKEFLKSFPFRVISKKGLIKKEILFPFFQKEDRDFLRETQKILKNLNPFFTFTLGRDDVSDEVKLITLGDVYTFPEHKHNKIINDSICKNYILVRVG